MKKLLVLMLVFGMTSLAGAAITLDGPTEIMEGDTVAIGIYNTDGLDYLSYMTVSFISEGGFSMSNPYLTPIAGDASKIGLGSPYIIGDGWETEVTLAKYEGTSTPGVQFTWDLTCLLQGVTVTVELWDDNLGYVTPADTLTISQIPEPMTIALLGLGGLFLLRRRK